MPRRKIVAGNWKMNGSEVQSAELLAGIVAGRPASAQSLTLVCPPFVLLTLAHNLLKDSNVALGAQTVSEHDCGAFTGEVEAQMLIQAGCSHVIVGHSERRALFLESDEVVAAKYQRALTVGLIPILCVGETLQERESGATNAVVERQLNAVLQTQGADAIASGIVAYEPVWAIGTGKTASPEQANAVHQHIRSVVAKKSSSVAEDLQILYGGSVKGDNAAQLFSMSDIDGGLIGGASLKVSDFLAICQAAD